MSKYTHRCEIRLSETEYQKLKNDAAKAGLSVSAFIRKSIANCTIKEAPPVDLPQMIREVRRVGSNINQILLIANSRGLLDVPALRKALLELREVEKMIVAEYRR